MAEFTQFEKDSPEHKRFEAAFAAQPSASAVSPSAHLELPQGLLRNPFAAPTSVPGPAPSFFQRFQQAAPKIASQAALAVPGTGLLGPTLGQAALAGSASLASGAGPLKAAESAGGAALGQLGGGVLAKGLGRAVSGTQLPKYTERLATDLTEKLGSSVPPWKGLSGLKEMFFSQNGWNRLHRFYDDSLKEVIKRGENKLIQVSLEDAKALGIKDLVASADPLITTVGVSAAKAAEAVTGKWTKNPGLYARIAGDLDAAGVGDPTARKAYKTAMGLRAYFVKQGAIRPDGSLDLLKAQAGLVKGKSVDELLRRGLGEFTNLLMPGGQAVQKGSLQAPLGAVGGILGAAGGHSFGLLPIGGLFGAYHGARLGARIPTYSNVPSSPLPSFLQQLGPRLGAAAGGQITPMVGP